MKQNFAKGYSQTYTNEVYQIREVAKSIPVTYYLKNTKNQDIKGCFYGEELSQVVSEK